MNRYPLWKYILVFGIIILGLLYTLPNFFGETPAIQVSSAKTTIKIDLATQAKIEQILNSNKVEHIGIEFSNGSHASIKVRFRNTDVQLKAKDLISKQLNTNAEDATYIVALNLLSSTPKWLASIGANPMFLGLDLRGGVHFLLQVDMNGAINKKIDTLVTDMRLILREKDVSHNGIEKQEQTLLINAIDATQAQTIKSLLQDKFKELNFLISPNNANNIIANFIPQSINDIRDNAIKQNIVTLSNRVNELGVSEPIIQQQGTDRIMVQLPGVQDTARAKDIIGRTATLESRLAHPTQSIVMNKADAPSGHDVYAMSEGRFAVLKKGVIFTGDRINTASAGFDQNQQPIVSIKLDAAGGRNMRETTKENIGKPMAMVLFEKNKAEVLTVATIQGEFGQDFQITGQKSTEQANDLALLLRAGSLAAPMNIIEERTIGPSLGADNIAKGFNSLLYGFLAISIFMMMYYGLFGVFSVLALSVNVLLLIGILSIIQATLTLPGIAAIALALGMAIDSNVLINERIREELRDGANPQSAINGGFSHAWDTIFDSNVTTLIAGTSLLAFGSGPIKGFAVVHCLGILTSMFSSVMFSRSLSNLWYGRRKKLAAISIGQVWKS
jgi:preprotein translocase subunit SecD